MAFGLVSQKLEQIVQQRHIVHACTFTFAYVNINMTNKYFPVSFNTLRKMVKDTEREREREREREKREERERGFTSNQRKKVIYGRVKHGKRGKTKQSDNRFASTTGRGKCTFTLTSPYTCNKLMNILSRIFQSFDTQSRITGSCNNHLSNKF